MTLNKFIFSNQLKHRLARHMAFWLIFSLHFVIQNLMIGGPGEAKTSRTFSQSFFHFLYFLPIYLLSTYFFIEVLLPEFLYQRRYAGFIISSLLLFSVNFIIIYYSGVFYLHNTLKLSYSQITFSANKYHAIVDGMFVPFMLLGIAAGIKFSKKWFIQQRENERLAKQKLATELQLLKTSIHPRFLFHSLHTIQRHIDNFSEQSPALILQLSDLLSYILYEKDEPWVPVKKELEIIGFYINIQEKSFGGKLLFKTEFPENTEGKFIVPFLLLSIVENSFEYFFETGQKEPLLTLIIRINENVIHYQLFFSKPVDESAGSVLPDGKFLSLQKQLQNQYPGLHHLHATSDAESISIDLKLPLYSADLINVKKNTMMNEVPEPV
jgi:hypothetical protein